MATRSWRSGAQNCVNCVRREIPFPTISAAGILGFSALSEAYQSLEAAYAAGEDIAARLDRVKASRAAALKAIFALKRAA